MNIGFIFSSFFTDDSLGSIVTILRLLLLFLLYFEYFDIYDPVSESSLFFLSFAYPNIFNALFLTGLTLTVFSLYLFSISGLGLGFEESLSKSIRFRSGLPPGLP